MNKRSQELNIKIIIILIICLILLVISIIFFSSAAKQIFSNLIIKIKSAFKLLNATT
ncbi:MAG: hypothetical protein QXM27_01145 [Candidatus Pacearchaeota archaeon]